MTHPRFARFLTLVREHTRLVVDMCGDPDVLSRAQLLHYLDHYGIPAVDKDALIGDLTTAAILHAEPQGYTVNPALVDLVNYYERRGRLISATFLRDQLLAITDLTDRLQREVFAGEQDQTALLDTIDDLYRLVREVRDAGLDHYVACMRLLGDIKRNSGAHAIDRRLDDLETAQRRYIEPLRALIDPAGDYVPRIALLHRLVEELGRQDALVLQSEELERRRRRLLSDLHFIDHELLRGFAAIVDTARTLLRSFMDEQSLKDAVAYTLAHLDAVWPQLAAVTLLAAGRNAIHAAPQERMAAFLGEVVHRRLLPRPRPLTIVPPTQQRADDLMLSEHRVWQTIAAARTIVSWPAFVVQTFASYSPDEQLRAIVLPQLRTVPQLRLTMGTAAFVCAIGTQTVRVRDFGVAWAGGV